MAKLASLTVNEVSAVAQPDTYTQALSLAAGVPEFITVPSDANGEKAGFVVFGASVYSDYFARVFDTWEGYDRVTNGTFTSDTGWTKGAGWTIAAGVATATGAISTALSQTAADAYQLVEGQAYLVTYTTTRSAGSITPNIGGTAGTATTTGATYSEIIVAGSTQAISFTTAGFTGTVDNITIKACAAIPGDNTTGLVARQNPVGLGLSKTPLYVSVITAVASIITASFYKNR